MTPDCAAPHRVARVAADPARALDFAVPGGRRPGLRFFRWHGSPRMYGSRYDIESIATLAAQRATAAGDVETWCIFDNTASGAAIEQALDVRARQLNVRTVVGRTAADRNPADSCSTATIR